MSLPYKSRTWVLFTHRQWQSGVKTGRGEHLIYGEEPSWSVSLPDTSRQRHHSLAPTIARRSEHQSNARARTHTRRHVGGTDSFNWVTVSLSQCLTQEEEDKSTFFFFIPASVIEKINPRWEIYKACPPSLAAQGEDVLTSRCRRRNWSSNESNTCTM